jgi:two-component system, NarL family, response regulator LiaR
VISVLICDDHAVVRYGIMAVLEAHGGFRLVGAVADGQSAALLAERDPPDVVLMDLLMQGMNGVEATRLVKKAAPRAHVMLLTSHEGNDYLVDATRAGAISYLLKDTPPAELVLAIERTARGEPSLHPRIAAAMIEVLRRAQGASADSLSARETEVIMLIADGLSNARIAERLSISEKTVKNHVSNLLEKLQLEDRTQAAVYAWREGYKSRVSDKTNDTENSQ